jgi:type VI secretion system secreted protein Hcp
MKIRIRKIFGSLAAAIVLAINTPIADAAAYVKFDGIDGEATDSMHSKWSDLSSFSYNLKREPATAGTPSVLRVSDIVCVKELDKASPKLAESLLTGRVVKTVDISVTRTVDGGEVVYLEIQLTNVSLTLNKVTVDTGLGDRGAEEISFSYEEISVVYTPFDSRGAPGDPVKYSWNVELGA